MGEELKTSPQEEKISIEKSFNDACPYFIAIGVSYDDFWNNDPMIAKAYLDAHKIRQKQENEHYWLQGYYFYIALCDVAPILVFGAKKGTKIQPYPKEPFALTQEEIDARKERERQNRLLTLRERLVKSVKMEGK